MGNTVARDMRKVKFSAETKRCLDLRLEGKSYQEVADAVGMTRGGVYKRIQRIIQASVPKEEIEAVRSLELRRLDKLLSAVMPRALRGNTRAVRTALLVGQRRADLLGLDPPKTLTQVHMLVDKELEAFLERLEPHIDVESYRIALAVASGELGGPQAGLPEGGRHPEGEAGPAGQPGGGEAAGPL